eukprot:COSAG06_NODE_4071_length_4604_cov_1.827119_4_plen_327_part_00
MAVVESLLIYQLRKRKAVKEAVAGAFRLNSNNGGNGGSNGTQLGSSANSGVEGVASTRGVGLFKQRVAVQPSSLAAGGGGGGGAGGGSGSGSESLGLARRMAGGAGGHSGEPLPEQQPNGLAGSGSSFAVEGPGAKYTIQSSSAAAGSAAARGQTVSDASMEQQPPQVQQQPGSARAGSVSGGLPSAGTSLDLDEVVNSYGLDVHMGMEAMSTTPAPSPPAGRAGEGEKEEEEEGQGAADFDGNAGGGGAGNSTAAATDGLLSGDGRGSSSDRSRKWLCGPRRAAAAGGGGGGGGGAVEWLTEHLDSVSLVVFPVSYAIVTAMLFA